MQLYMRLAEAIARNQGMREAISATKDLPLEERYLWRVLSALNRGFADFDNVNVVIDRKTLAPDDRLKVAELVQNRLVQFCTSADT